MYAIVETGGKQYKVSPGQTVDVEKLEAAEGSTVELDKVLLVSDGDKVKTGNPVVAGAKVIATSQGEFKGRKVIIFKFKAKTRYHRKNGHRQIYTRLKVDKIVADGLSA